METSALTIRILIVCCGIVAMALNVGPWIYIFSKFRKFLPIEKEIRMKYADAIAIKDGVTRSAIIEEFKNDSEIISRIEKCLVKGKKVWRRRMTAAWGRPQADAFFDVLESEVLKK